MKILKCEAKNFASYENISLSPQKGLTLIYGATGSGKSTIPDLPCWILFGTTAKNGAADDVKSWKHPNEPTEGWLELEHNGKIISIYRRRHKNDNDLYWTHNGKTYRGKDLTETLALLESSVLGFDNDAYLFSGYYCEFSPSASFFMAKAKDRRTLFENVASLSYPINISEKANESRKICRDKLRSFSEILLSTTGAYDSVVKSKHYASNKSRGWVSNKERSLYELSNNIHTYDKRRKEAVEKEKEKASKWEKERQAEIEMFKKDLQSDVEIHLNDVREELKHLKDKKCPTCKGPTRGEEYDKLLELESVYKEDLQKQKYIRQELSRVEKQVNPHLAVIESLEKQVNVDQIEYDRLKKQENPFEEQLSRLEKEQKELEEKIESIEKDIKALEHEVHSLEQIVDLSTNLKSILLERTVSEIEKQTNEYIEKYFDSVISVSFKTEGTDNLSVTIKKSGFTCNYKQLSKGQRQILKLCFSVSVMKASQEKSGIHLSNLWFDESLDGMDSDLKIKAFDLFQELEQEYESISIIDHSPDFQNLFANKLHVSLIDDCSQIDVI